jgi:hypothetical protein
MSLVQISQNDFAAGTLRGSAPDVQPGVGLYTATNGLFNDDGDVYRRGGTISYGTPTLGTPLTWVWSGRLGIVNSLLAATTEGVYYYGPGVVSADSTGLARPVRHALVGGRLYLPTLRFLAATGAAGEVTAGAWVPPVSVSSQALEYHVESIAGRLVVASGNRIAFSEPVGYLTDPAFVADDFHELPGGIVVVGLAAIQDTLLVFTNYGLWSITNMAYDLTDAAGNIQQTLSEIVPEMALLHEAGLAAWSGRIVAPCTDRVYLIDLLSPPVSVSESIVPIYMNYVNTGCLPGGAKVYRNTLFLPILRLEGGVHHAVGMLTCRLNKPVRGRYVYYPWSEFTGHALKHRMFDLRRPVDTTLTPQSPGLLAAGEDGRITNFTDVFAPSAANASDADGTTHAFQVETRDFPTGQGQPNHLRRIRLRYTADSPAAVNVSYSSDRQTWTALADGQVIPPGRDPLSWWLPNTARVRYVRTRFTVPGPVDRLVVHGLDLGIRPATHAR